MAQRAKVALMRKRGFQLCIAGCFLTAGCDGPAIDASQSLVGATRLPTSRELSREIIQINQGFGSTSTGLLTYELQPNDTVNVTLTHRDLDKSSDVVDRAETFRLSPQTALGVRRKLWRLRPQVLEGIEQVIRPADCPPPPTDTFPEASVLFMPERPKPGVAHVEVGVVDVPFAQTCATRQGAEARDIVRSVLKSFPPSKAAAEYNQRRVKVVVPL